MISGRRGNKFWCLALFALAALLACALSTLSPTQAAPPDDLELELSFYRDSDGVAQPGSTIQVQAELKFTGAESVGALPISDAVLRIAGDLEWDLSGRSSLPGLSWSPVTREYRGATGEAVAVQDGTGANAIQVIGAPDATVNGIPGGGAVHVWVDRSYAQRLTGEPSDGGAYPQGYRRLNGGFGLSVDVGNGVIVVGAPNERGSEPSGGLIGPGLGAAYVFERNDGGEWERTAKLTVGDNPSFDDIGYRFVPTGFGRHVAISDDGATIVVSQLSSPAFGADDNWGATAHVFSRPDAGWTDMDTNHANVTSLRYDSNGAAADDTDVVNARRAAVGDVDIAGDGSVVAVGAPRLPYSAGSYRLYTPGAVLVFNRPTGGWTAESDRLLEQNATLAATDHEHRNVQVGSDVAISESGEVIVSNGTTRSISTGSNDPRDPVTGWPGSAFVWERPGSGWTDSNSATATLSDSTGRNGDQFGSSVAVSDSGNRVVVADRHQGRRFQFDEDDETTLPAIHVFDKPASGWTDDATADLILHSSGTWVLTQDLAIDGESRLVVGAPGLGGYLLDLSQPNPQAPRVALSGTCDVSISNSIVTHTCRMFFWNGGIDPRTLPTLFPTITIPDGTPDGEFTVSASATVDGVSYSDTVEISVRDVDEVAEVTLDFATDPVAGYADTSDDKPYPSAIAPGEITRLRLSVLNDNGEAAGPDAADGVAKILFTTTAGTFSQGAVSNWPVWLINRFSPLIYEFVNCEGGNDQPTCAVDLTRLSADNADRIVIGLAHPGADKPGTAEVRATVITNDGEVFNPPPLTVTFTGRAETLVLSEPAAGVLNVDAPLDGGTDADDRDVLSLSVTAVDENDVQVDVPLGLPASPTPQQLNDATRVVVRDPDGDIVPISRYGGWDWTYDTDQERTSLDFKLQINASEENALDIGEYTLELRIGGLKAERAFRVSGGPASLALGEPEGAFEPNGQFTITATVADAEGNPVPDGTAVQWEARSASTRATVLVQLSADRTTSAGSASATYLAVGPGRATVSARTGGNASDAALVTISQASARTDGDDDPAALIADGLRGRTSGLAPWLGRRTITASALLDSLTAINSIALWDADGWQRYERSDPDSADFTIAPGAVILLEE